MASEIGIEILTEEQYRTLQTIGEFDLKTSSWVLTPPLSENLAAHCVVIAALQKIYWLPFAKNLTGEMFKRQ